jgi:hypothetical protein
LPPDAPVRIHGHVLLAVFVAVLASACKSKTTRLANELDASISWAATLEAVAKSWADNRVPARYAERTIDEARAAFRTARESRAASIADALRDAVRGRDRRALAEPLHALHAERDALEHRLDQLKQSR